ncbi:uncharacterized protein LY89DRAFT_746067 [Mollisia scopiformis]|uniref:Uncharacterized protein n=1 Tax=Mollisia scopiformis TaxID=149040 RepID=A0A194XCX8_MOLSC|nr:uncharacterized protein LY89DRAFT_746067 [Mollisia scopiformis]KUJ18006.1 hypothetical protein LY89DRAFT_746067 [Mollisia scopiformis]
MLMLLVPSFRRRLNPLNSSSSADGAGSCSTGIVLDLDDPPSSGEATWEKGTHKPCQPRTRAPAGVDPFQTSWSGWKVHREEEDEEATRDQQTGTGGRTIAGSVEDPGEDDEGHKGHKGRSRIGVRPVLCSHEWGRPGMGLDGVGLVWMVVMLDSPSQDQCSSRFGTLSILAILEGVGGGGGESAEPYGDVPHGMGMGLDGMGWDWIVWAAARAAAWPRVTLYSVRVWSGKTWTGTGTMDMHRHGSWSRKRSSLHCDHDLGPCASHSHPPHLTTPYQARPYRTSILPLKSGSSIICIIVRDPRCAHWPAYGKDDDSLPTLN